MEPEYGPKSLQAQANHVSSVEPMCVDPIPEGVDVDLDATSGTDVEPRPKQLGPGTRLGAYRIISVLGAGGMGCVYLAEHEFLRRKVAIKLLHGRYAQDPAQIERFFNEARAVNCIHNAHVIEVSDIVTLGSLHFFVMELLEGVSLADELKKSAELPLGRVLHIMQQLANALASAHDAGIIHRDLKPSNVVLIGPSSTGGNTDFVKLLDFGIAKVSAGAVPDASEPTAAGTLLGTPGYIAPEQILGTKVDHRADVYGFGVMLYRLLAGRSPFAADSWPELLVKHTTERPPPPRRKGTRLPAKLVELTMRCLEKRPENRPQTMHELQEALVLLQQTDPELATPLALPALNPSAPSQPTQPVLLRSAGIAAIVATAAVFLVAASFRPHVSLPVVPEENIVKSDVGLAKPEQPAANPTVNLPVAATPSAAPVALVEGPAPSPSTKQSLRKTAPRKAGSSVESVTFQLEIAQQLLRQKSFSQALQLCESLATIAPRHALVHRTMGIALFGLKQKARACEAFRTYLQYAPAATDRDRVNTLLGGCQ